MRQLSRGSAEQLGMRVSLNGLFVDHPHTGSGQYTLQLIEHLSGIDLHVARPRARGDLAKLLWEQIHWPREANRARADLLHCPYFALPLRRNKPAIVTIHDLIPLVLPAYRGSLMVRCYTWLQVLSCRSAEAIIVDSQHSRSDVLRLLRVPPDRVHVIYLGVDGRFRPDRSGPSPLSQPYIFYIGGWDQRKNVPALIHAFERLSISHPQLLLAIAGEPGSGGPLFSDLRRLAAPLGDRVRFLGRVSEEEKMALFQHAGLFVFPSLYEGFGLDPLEALACGCPVVCSNASSLPEIVGDAAVLVDAGDAARLAEAMVRALDDPDPLRERGPAQAARFAWSETAAQTRAVYETVLK